MNKQHLYINALRDKQRGQSTSQFSVFLPSTFQAKQAVVLYAGVENGAYTFSDYNNSLYYYVGNTLYYIAMPTDKFINAVSDVDNDPDNDLDSIIEALFTSNNHDITVKFNGQTGKLTFTNNTNSTIRFVSSDEYEYQNIYTNKANVKLGLTQDLTNNNITSGQSITSQSLVRLKNEAYYITSSLIETNSFLGNQNVQYRSNPILARIPIYNEGFGSLQAYTNTDFEDTVTIFGENINSIGFTITDEFMLPVDLNGANVSIHLLLLS